MFSQMILHVIKPAIPVQFHFHLLPGLRKLRTLRDLQFMKYFTLSFLDAHPPCPDHRAARRLPEQKS